MKKLFRNLLGCLALVMSMTSQAAIDTYGNLLAGSYQPSDPFATLEYNNVGNVYSFTLTAFDLDAIFTTGSFLGAIAVNSGGDDSPIISNVSGGIANVTVSPGGGPGGTWDFRFDLTDGQDRLTANEMVSWDATFDGPVVLTSDSFAIHVQGLTREQGGSAWYTPVPEPETYAMMLVGLGMLGFTAKKRQNKK